MIHIYIYIYIYGFFNDAVYNQQYVSKYLLNPILLLNFNKLLISHKTNWIIRQRQLTD